MPTEPYKPSPYWRRTRRLSAVLVAAWLLVTLGVGLFGRALEFRLFGWPFGFWMTAQLALFLFCCIVWIYAVAMDRLDRDHGNHADD